MGIQELSTPSRIPAAAPIVLKILGNLHWSGELLLSSGLFDNADFLKLLLLKGSIKPETAVRLVQTRTETWPIFEKIFGVSPNSPKAALAVESVMVTSEFEEVSNEMHHLKEKITDCDTRLRETQFQLDLEQDKLFKAIHEVETISDASSLLHLLSSFHV